MAQVNIGYVPELSGQKVQCINVDDHQFVLIFHQQQFSLLDNHCPHKGALLCEGELVDDAIQCPWHKARFDVQSGKGLSALAGTGVKSYPLKVLDGQLFAELS